MSENIRTGESLHLQRIFVPLVSDARKRLRLRLEESLFNLLTDKAHAEWERYLLVRLYSAGKKVVTQQFQTFRSSRSAFAKRRRDQQLDGDAASREFVGNDPTERLRKILTEYPGLAGLAEALIENWVSTVTEFLERLAHDLPKLRDRFQGKSFAYPVESLDVGLSDPHQGGRSVVRLNFPCSESLIYKPRTILPETCFSVLLGQLNAKEPPHDLRGAQCWDRKEYGWMEDILPRPCRHSTDLNAFYWRAGALLALIYLSRGVDMHKGNLIAAAAFPILIDLETLWHPQEHIGAVSHPSADTVLRTGFLPQIGRTSGGSYRLNALGHQPASNLETAHHLPVFAGTAHLAPNFLPDILSGFRWIGEQVFEEHRSGGEFQTWLQILVRCRRRKILRSTLWYYSALEQITAPLSLRNAVSFKAESLLASQGDPPMTEDEEQSLLQMDVPYIEQTVEHEVEQRVALPVQNIEAFLKQEVFIIDALRTGSEWEWSGADC